MIDDQQPDAASIVTKLYADSAEAHRQEFNFFDIDEEGKLREENQPFTHGVANASPSKTDLPWTSEAAMKKNCCGGLLRRQPICGLVFSEIPIAFAGSTPQWPKLHNPEDP